MGATADEQEAVLSRFNAKAASNGFVEAMVEDDWGVFCNVDPVPMDAFCANDSVIKYSDLLTYKLHNLFIGENKKNEGRV